MQFKHGRSIGFVVEGVALAGDSVERRVDAQAGRRRRGRRVRGPLRRQWPGGPAVVATLAGPLGTGEAPAAKPRRERDEERQVRCRPGLARAARSSGGTRST